MKKYLLIHFYLFLLTSFLTINAFSQALPDPGTDPLKPVDSTVHTPIVKSNVCNNKEVMNISANRAANKSIENDSSSVYKIEEKRRQTL